MTTASLTFSSITLHGKFARGRPNFDLTAHASWDCCVFITRCHSYELGIQRYSPTSSLQLASQNIRLPIGMLEPKSPQDTQMFLNAMLVMIAIHHFFNATLYNFRCVGNLTPVTREPLQITFSPFRENRLAVTVRVTDPSQPFTCRLAFLKEPRKDRQGNVRTICNLSIDLSEEVRHQITDR